jgi:hypothetical protein
MLRNNILKSGDGLLQARIKVQMNLTEGRLAVKIAPSRHLLISFIDLNNLPFSRFSPEERMRIGGAHTFLGNDLDSTPSADVELIKFTAAKNWRWRQGDS